MYSVVSIEHDHSLINGFLADKNNPKLINYLVAKLGQAVADQVHKQLDQEIVTVVETVQMIDENLLEELLEYGSVFASQKLLVSCEPIHTKTWLDLGFKILAQNEQVLLEWG